MHLIPLTNLDRINLVHNDLCAARDRLSLLKGKTVPITVHVDGRPMMFAESSAAVRSMLQHRAQARIARLERELRNLGIDPCAGAGPT